MDQHEYTIEQADVRRIKEFKIYAWMEVYRTPGFVTSRKRCYHIRLKDGIQLADKSLAIILYPRSIGPVQHCRLELQSTSHQSRTQDLDEQRTNV